MSNDCSIDITVATADTPRFRKVVQNAGFSASFPFHETEENGFTTFRAERIARGGIDLLEALAEADIPYCGRHGPGDDYPECSFFGRDGENHYAQTDETGVFLVPVVMSGDGTADVDPDAMAEIRKFAEGLHAAEQRVLQKARYTDQAFEVYALHGGTNPREIMLEASTAGDPGVFHEINVSAHIGERCIADIVIGIDESGEVRILSTVCGHGENDHTIAVYPERSDESEKAVNMNFQ